MVTRERPRLGGGEGSKEVWKPVEPIGCHFSPPWGTRRKKEQLVRDSNGEVPTLGRGRGLE